jgi:hypothetical protein
MIITKVIKANKAKVMERVVIPLEQTLLLVEGTGLVTKAVYIGQACTCSGRFISIMNRLVYI